MNEQLTNRKITLGLFLKANENPESSRPRRRLLTNVRKKSIQQLKGYRDLEQFQHGKMFIKDLWSEQYYSTVMRIANLRDMDLKIKQMNRQNVHESVSKYFKNESQPKKKMSKILPKIKYLNITEDDDSPRNRVTDQTIESVIEQCDEFKKEIIDLRNQLNTVNTMSTRKLRKLKEKQEEDKMWLTSFVQKQIAVRKR